MVYLVNKIIYSFYLRYRLCPFDYGTWLQLEAPPRWLAIAREISGGFSRRFRRYRQCTSCRSCFNTRSPSLFIGITGSFNPDIRHAYCENPYDTYFFAFKHFYACEAIGTRGATGILRVTPATRSRFLSWSEDDYSGCRKMVFIFRQPGEFFFTAASFSERKGTLPEATLILFDLRRIISSADRRWFLRWSEGDFHLS